MPDDFRNYIAGEWTAGPSATVNRNPSDVTDVIGEYAQADAAQARTAIAAAKAAFPAWARGSIQERSNILDRAGTEILARKDELGRLPEQIAALCRRVLRKEYLPRVQGVMPALADHLTIVDEPDH